MQSGLPPTLSALSLTAPWLPYGQTDGQFLALVTLTGQLPLIPPAFTPGKPLLLLSLGVRSSPSHLLALQPSPTPRPYLSHPCF